MPRYLFFGLYRIPMYEWYWGHTAAQIELIDIDAPFVCYAKHEERHGRGLKPGDKGYKPNKKKLDACVEKWQKRKAAREARGFDLNRFLTTGEHVPIESNEKSQ